MAGSKTEAPYDLEKVNHADLNIGRGGIFEKMFADLCEFSHTFQLMRIRLARRLPVASRTRT